MSNYFQIPAGEHKKALHLLEEIKRQSGTLGQNNEATQIVITSLAESVMWVMISATPIDGETPV